MQSNAFPLQLILGHHFIWTRWTRWALNVVVAGLMIIFPSEV